MPEDPGAKRTIPAPPHPSGYAAADDAPVHVAPMLDVRPASSARVARDSAPWLGPPAGERQGQSSTIVFDEVPFSLPIPAEERFSSRPPEPGEYARANAPLIPVAPVAAMNAGEEPAPVTVSFDSGRSSSAPMPAWPRRSEPLEDLPPPVGGTLPQAAEPVGTPHKSTIPPPTISSNRLPPEHPGPWIPTPAARPAEIAPPPAPSVAYSPASIAQASPASLNIPPSLTPPESSPTSSRRAAEAQAREALVRELRAIGSVDERPDRSVDKDVGARASLARARALRFRISLHDGWPLEAEAPALAPESQVVGAEGHLALDLTLEVALMVTIADGAPTGFTEASAESFPPVVALIAALRARRHDLVRAALRDRGAAAIARLTIVGWNASLDAIARAARSVPNEARFLALAVATKVALTPEINGHRLGALADLERALALPTGTLARSLESARSHRDDWF